MPESLLSPSRVLLFGRKMNDLQIVQNGTKTVRLASVEDMTTNGLVLVDRKKARAGDKILVKDQDNPANNAIYTAAAGAWPNPAVDQPADGETVFVEEGAENRKSIWVKQGQVFTLLSHGKNPKLGHNQQLENQLQDALFARIYGFSYDGTYFDLPRPALFLVHGEGQDAVLPSKPAGSEANLARTPLEPSLSGVGAADFQLADGLKVWSYDKADYTIRMDVESGMFEQVLLEAYFADGGHVSGMKVSGMKVSGMKVAGMKVAGMKVAGSRLGRGDAGD